jgi:muramoyltetrapeptide carboxypeptidase
VGSFGANGTLPTALNVDIGTLIRVTTPPPAPQSLIRPPALRPGDRVAVLCVSSPLAEAAPLDNGLAVLRFAGLEPVLYPSATAEGSLRPYLAGDDAMRAKDLTAALTDPDIAGIIFTKGGYGAQRTLELINWNDLATPRGGSRPPGPPWVLKPKVLAGFSDLTAILEAVAVKLGWASLFSPMVATSRATAHYGFGSLLRTLMRPAEATEISYPDAVTITPGVARGVTTGGTLCLLATSLGTPTSKNARGGILLLEDVGEEDYRIDRMLSQLRRSGYLDGVAGIVAGNFDECGPAEQVEAVIVERLGDLGIPMIARANVGHGGTFQTFPIGIAAELDADARTLRLLDPPLDPAQYGE